MKVSIDLDDEEVKILKKRAKKNLLELDEMVQDIIRRSCIKSKSIGVVSDKCDDALVSIFSRNRRSGKI